MVIGVHVDDITHEKICKGEYIDFSKLLPKERGSDEDSRLELINKGGQTYFIPMGECTTVNITNFHHWEQAFRIFSNIYTSQFPDRATKLIQYNHIIFTASSTFVWDNVYTYDKEFRRHMGKYPQRCWSVILQQAWSMYLKDRIYHQGDQSRLTGGNSNFNHSKAQKEICKRFNKGKCMAGSSCKYDHHCLECGKFGHGAHICQNKGNGGQQTSNASATLTQGSSGQTNK